MKKKEKINEYIWTSEFTYVKKIEEIMKEGEKKYEMKKDKERRNINKERLIKVKWRIGRIKLEEINKRNEMKEIPKRNEFRNEKFRKKKLIENNTSYFFKISFLF